ncbi:MAG: exopolysaccharide biosynthesis protein [Puniceicoccales bacterium]|jgi:hypothetical protein|nr:exopolysaccharide biosynthesis protein [Puniceicoccales bacterium]
MSPHKLPSQPAAASPPAHDTAPAQEATLGEKVIALAAECGDGGTTLGTLAERLQGRSVLLLVFILSLPFCQPAPLTGLATILGIPLTYWGWRLSLGRPATLPRRLRGIRIPPRLFPSVLHATGRLMRWLESRPGDRLRWLLAPAWVRRACAINIFISSFLLALPALLPGSNFFPALPVALTAAALLENDGRMLLRALAATLVNAAYWLSWAVLFLLYGAGAAEKVQGCLRSVLQHLRA